MLGAQLGLHLELNGLLEPKWQLQLLPLLLMLLLLPLLLLPLLLLLLLLLLPPVGDC